MFTKAELDEAGAANMQEIFRVQAEVRKLLRAELMKSKAMQADATPDANFGSKETPPPPQ